MIYCMTTREPVTILCKLAPSRPVYPIDVRVRYFDGTTAEMSSAKQFGHGWHVLEDALRAAPLYLGRI